MDLKSNALISLMVCLVVCLVIPASAQENVPSTVGAITTADYKNDTLGLFYSYLWKRDTPAYAVYYRLAYKEGDYYHSQDYYASEKSLMMDEWYADLELTQREGRSMTFSRSGKLTAVGNYFKGQKSGWWLSYNEAGRCTDSSLYLNGMQAGRCVSFYDDGSLKEIRNLDRKGAGTGDVTCLFPSGALRKRGYYGPSMKKDSIWTRYYPTGQIASVLHCNNDSVVNYTCYDSLGKEQSCIVDEIPQFPGGTKGLLKYIDGNLKFPKGYRTVSTQRVFVRFIVDEEGNIKDATIIKRLHPAFDAEALRVIRNMPKWSPKIQYNEAVETYYSLPFAFRTEG